MAKRGLNDACGQTFLTFILFRWVHPNEIEKVPNFNKRRRNKLIKQLVPLLLTLQRCPKPVTQS